MPRNYLKEADEASKQRQICRVVWGFEHSPRHGGLGNEVWTEPSELLVTSRVSVLIEFGRMARIQVARETGYAKHYMNNANLHTLGITYKAFGWEAMYHQMQALQQEVWNEKQG